MQPFSAEAVPLSGTTLVEASAGTGKTYAISSLFLRFLLEKGASVEQILVLTFTEAATLELKDRIRRRLHDAAAALGAGKALDPALAAIVAANRARMTDEAMAKRLDSALQNVDQAAIFTIHGFCHKVLRDHAFETGALFDAELREDDTAIKDEVLADFWAREVGSAPSPLVELLARNKIAPASCRGLADLIARHPRISIACGVAPDGLTASDALGGDENTALALFRRKLIEYLRVELPRRKAQLGVLSFDDLLEQLHTALHGAHAAELAASIRRRFPNALIDEFQDTDPTQYEIFRAIYRGTPAAERCALFLVGDPKQAIYGFRGADIFAYLSAVRDTPAERRFTLSTNYRSDAGLIRALDQLFADLERPFLLPGIGFPSIRAERTAEALRLPDGVPSAALEFLFLPSPPKSKGVWNKPEAEQAICKLVAREIHDLLRNGATIDGRPVRASDVAVLTRTNQQAFDLRQALADVGVQGVVLGDSSVYERPEANELLLLLSAVADPSDQIRVRAALTTDLLGVSAAELELLEEDEQVWERWLEDFRLWHELWLQQGFVQMFRRVLDSRDVQRRLLARSDGERRMTNFLHLMELLHGAALASDLGPSGLVHWLSQERSATEKRQGTSESAQVRLESDESAVKLLTVHKSKGLEFGIVYCPHLWVASGLRLDEKACFTVHDPADGDALKLALDAKACGDTVFSSFCEWERFAENLRLLYVALTRAKHRTTVVWGALSRDYYKSALAYALHWPREQAPRDGDPKALCERLKLDELTMLAELRARAERAQGSIVLREVREPGAARALTSEPWSAPELTYRTLQEPLGSRGCFRVASFSGLLASQTRHNELHDEGRDWDELSPEKLAPAKLPSTRAWHDRPAGLADFPRGSRAGNFFHELLEKLDFTRRDCQGDVAAKLVTFAYPMHLQDSVLSGVNDFLDTPLDSAPEPLRLRQIGAEQRLNELEFYFPVADGPRSSSARARAAAHESRSLELGRVTQRELVRAFAEVPSEELSRDYPRELEQLHFLPIEGYLKGYIDLVFSHAGRFYLADYKTNHLGDSLVSYARERLPQVMAASHYYLQYHLYTVALHRYLQQRIPSYDYDTHFGGVYYLFIKGMSPSTGPESGVFFERPPFERIRRLSAMLADPAPDEAARV